ncbi:MAG: hypothetical protein D6748_07280 [Calditrichaeota bacterium]|nr:MAG: hypothetical protein D6748_07280 [Calditrichota bacterium]
MKRNIIFPFTLYLFPFPFLIFDLFIFDLYSPFSPFLIFDLLIFDLYPANNPLPFILSLFHFTLYLFPYRFSPPALPPPL